MTAPRPRRPRPPDGLQLDLTSAVARLQQIEQEGGFYGEGGLVELLAERLLTCDLPRLRGHIDDETLRWCDQFGETFLVHRGKFRRLRLKFWAWRGKF
jgi:hypothetical protein